MVKKMISIKLAETTIEILKELAEHENRSQGGQIEHLILKDAKEKGIKPKEK